VASGAVSEGVANTIIQELARILIPVNFNRSARFRHDPALTIPPLPALDAASKIAGLDTDGQGFARTQLVRGQNHVIAEFRAAQTLIARLTA
jgi:N-acetylated-alpha-linked acidic dipeptidase